MDKRVKFTWDKDGVVQKEVISYDPPKDDFYKARISTLEKENMKLYERIGKLEKSIGIAEVAMEHQETVCDGISNELNEIIKEKDDEIEVLKGEIKMLEAAIVKGALREVLA